MDEQDFESTTSANSITPAWLGKADIIIQPARKKSKAFSRKILKGKEENFSKCTCKMKVDTHKSVGVCFFMVR